MDDDKGSNAGSEIFVVERLLEYGVRSYDGGIYGVAYKVTWEDYDSNFDTWEPRDSFVDWAFIEQEVARLQRENPSLPTVEESERKAQEMTAKAKAKAEQEAQLKKDKAAAEKPKMKGKYKAPKKITYIDEDGEEDVEEGPSSFTAKKSTKQVARKSSAPSSKPVASGSSAASTRRTRTSGAALFNVAVDAKDLSNNPELKNLLPDPDRGVKALPPGVKAPPKPLKPEPHNELLAPPSPPARHSKHLADVRTSSSGHKSASTSTSHKKPSTKSSKAKSKQPEPEPPRKMMKTSSSTKVAIIPDSDDDSSDGSSSGFEEDKDDRYSQRFASSAQTTEQEDIQIDYDVTPTMAGPSAGAHPDDVPVQGFHSAAASGHSNKVSRGTASTSASTKPKKQLPTLKEKQQQRVQQQQQQDSSSSSSQQPSYSPLKPRSGERQQALATQKKKDRPLDPDDIGKNRSTSSSSQPRSSTQNAVASTSAAPASTTTQSKAKSSAAKAASAPAPAPTLAPTAAPAAGPSEKRPRKSKKDPTFDPDDPEAAANSTDSDAGPAPPKLRKGAPTAAEEQQKRAESLRKTAARTSPRKQPVENAELASPRSPNAPGNTSSIPSSPKRKPVSTPTTPSSSRSKKGTEKAADSDDSDGNNSLFDGDGDSTDVSPAQKPRTGSFASPLGKGGDRWNNGLLRTNPEEGFRTINIDRIRGQPELKKMFESYHKPIPGIDGVPHQTANSHSEQKKRALTESWQSEQLENGTTILASKIRTAWALPKTGEANLRVGGGPANGQIMAESFQDFDTVWNSFKKARDYWVYSAGGKEGTREAKTINLEIDALRLVLHTINPNSRESTTLVPTVSAIFVHVSARDQVLGLALPGKEGFGEVSARARATDTIKIIRQERRRELGDGEGENGVIFCFFGEQLTPPTSTSLSRQVISRQVTKFWSGKICVTFTPEALIENFSMFLEIAEFVKLVAAKPTRIDANRQVIPWIHKGFIAKGGPFSPFGVDESHLNLSGDDSRREPSRLSQVVEGAENEGSPGFEDDEQQAPEPQQNGTNEEEEEEAMDLYKDLEEYFPGGTTADADATRSLVPAEDDQPALDDYDEDEDEDEPEDMSMYLNDDAYADAAEDPLVEEEPAAEDPLVEEEPAAEDPLVEEEPAAEDPLVEEEPAAEDPPVMEEEPAADEGASPVDAPVNAQLDSAAAAAAEEESAAPISEEQPIVEEKQELPDTQLELESGAAEKAQDADEPMAVEKDLAAELVGAAPTPPEEEAAQSRGVDDASLKKTAEEPATEDLTVIVEEELVITAIAEEPAVEEEPGNVDEEASAADVPASSTILSGETSMLIDEEPPAVDSATAGIVAAVLDATLEPTQAAAEESPAPSGKLEQEVSSAAELLSPAEAAERQPSEELFTAVHLGLDIEDAPLPSNSPAPEEEAEEKEEENAQMLENEEASVAATTEAPESPKEPSPVEEVEEAISTVETPAPSHVSTEEDTDMEQGSVPQAAQAESGQLEGGEPLGMELDLGLVDEQIEEDSSTAAAAVNKPDEPGEPTEQPDDAADVLQAPPINANVDNGDEDYDDDPPEVEADDPPEPELETSDVAPHSTGANPTGAATLAAVVLALNGGWQAGGSWKSAFAAAAAAEPLVTVNEPDDDSDEISKVDESVAGHSPVATESLGGHSPTAAVSQMVTVQEQKEQEQEPEKAMDIDKPAATLSSLAPPQPIVKRVPRRQVRIASDPPSGMTEQQHDIVARLIYEIRTNVVHLVSPIVRYRAPKPWSEMTLHEKLTQMHGAAFPRPEDCVEYTEGELRETPAVEMCDINSLQSFSERYAATYPTIRRWVVIGTDEQVKNAVKVPGVDRMDFGHFVKLFAEVQDAWRDDDD